MAITLEQAPPRTLLEVYLGDHLAAGSAGIDLARRCLASNPSGPLADFLRQLLDDIEQDRRTLTGIVRRLGMSESRLKILLARVAERAGRLKLNGQIFGYSPLSRLVELEGLAVGVDARVAMLRSLREVTGVYPALAEFPLDELFDRAERQREELEHFRLAAARTAFGAPSS